jgi:carbon monoxide dehydrogenase subunit G
MHVRIERDHELSVRKDLIARMLSDVPAVIACIPGAAVTADHGDRTYDAQIGAEYGEMAALFHGSVKMDDAAADAFTARVAGRDAATGVSAEGSITLALRERSPGAVVLGAIVDLSFNGVMAPLAGAAARFAIPVLLESFARCVGEKAAALAAHTLPSASN